VLVGLIELNYDIKQGHNFKLTSEFHDPDDNLEEEHEIRHSIIYEYTPFSNVQLRFGYRTKEAPPLREQQNSQRIFIQTHFYF
jgi:hypothetical protein